jgi:CHAT domain-containing protein
MTQPNSDSTQNTFNISGSSIGNMLGSGTMNINEATQQRETANVSTSSETVTEGQQKVILILAANPKSTPALRLDEEVREIDSGLRRANQRDRFHLEQRWAVRSRDVQNALLDLKPQVVHFSGHGENEIGLILEDETGQSAAVSTEALAGLFELFADRVECVVLNACYSEVQAEAIANHIPYVIGMNKAIGDRAAIEFAIGFYDALGAGESIEFAYKLGLTAIRMAGIPEHLTPILKCKL